MFKERRVPEKISAICMKVEKQHIFLFIAFLLMFFPKQVHFINSHLLGRLLLVAGITYVSLNNVTIGLFMALALISASNQFRPFVIEGMTTPTDNTTKEPVKGVDREAIRLAILAKNSNSLPISTASTSTDAEVAASTEGMLSGKTSSPAAL
jgi:hypothetical protein